MYTTNDLSQKYLKEILHYNPLTGIWRWKITRGGTALEGSIAGTSKGYVIININGKMHTAGRLAFLYMLGYFPEHEAEHRDRNKRNNKWNNLREATRLCNLRNTGIFKNNKSGIKGVYRNKIGRNWAAQISIDNKSKRLGVHKNKDDAVRARWEAEKKYGWTNCCTTSSAYMYLKKNGLLHSVLLKRPK